MKKVWLHCKLILNLLLTVNPFNDTNKLFIDRRNKHYETIIFISSFSFLMPVENLDSYQYRTPYIHTQFLLQPTTTHYLQDLQHSSRCKNIFNYCLKVNPMHLIRHYITFLQSWRQLIINSEAISFFLERFSFVPSYSPPKATIRKSKTKREISI